jgi:hypothetical protein
MTLGGGTGAAAFRSPEDLVGRTVTVTLGPGELVQSSMLGSPTGSNLRPVSIPVDPDSLAALATGDPVDVLEAPSGGASASGATGGAAGSGLTVVLRGADLTAVTRPASGLLSGDGSSTVVVTLGVSNLAQAEAVVAASHAGTIELIRAEPSDGSGTGPASGSATGSGGSSAGSGADSGAGSGAGPSAGSAAGSAGSGASSSGRSTP